MHKTTSHLTGRAKVVSRECIRMFSVRPFILRHSTCSVVLLTARGPPTQDREAKADAGLRLMGTSDCCEHKMGWLSLLPAPLCCWNMLQQVDCSSMVVGSGIFFWVMGFRGPPSLTSCEKGELENAEETVATVFSVSDKCCRPKAHQSLAIPSRLLRSHEVFTSLWQQTPFLRLHPAWTSL